MDNKILSIIVCPICKGKLSYSENKKVLICKFDLVYYDIINGIPVLLEYKAKPVIN